MNAGDARSGSPPPGAASSGRAMAATVCSTCAWARPSSKQAANRLTTPIARSVAPSSSPVAPVVRSRPSNAATTSRPSTTSSRGYTASASGSSSAPAQVPGTKEICLVQNPDAPTRRAMRARRCSALRRAELLACSRRRARWPPARDSFCTARLSDLPLAPARRGSTPAPTGRGHGFPRSHGPMEQLVNGKWLTRPQTLPQMPWRGYFLA